MRLTDSASGETPRINRRTLTTVSVPRTSPSRVRCALFAAGVNGSEHHARGRISQDASQAVSLACLAVRAAEDSDHAPGHGPNVRRPSRRAGSRLIARLSNAIGSTHREIGKLRKTSALSPVARSSRLGTTSAAVRLCSCPLSTDCGHRRKGDQGAFVLVAELRIERMPMSKAPQTDNRLGFPSVAFNDVSPPRFT